MSNPRGTPLPIGQALQDSVRLKRLAEGARQRLALADHLREALPAELRSALGACNLHADGTLVVSTGSPEWATRLRFESTTLLDACRHHHPQALRVRVRVASGR